MSPLKSAAAFAALVFFWFAMPCVAQSIYQCNGKTGVVYTDRPCAGHRGKVIHQADNSDVIDHYLNLGQNELAKRYAQAHQLDALYASRVQAHQQRKEAEQKRQASAALAAEQYEKQAKQQALADLRARQAGLENENDALREQNNAYQDELASPATDYGSGGYLIDTSRRYERHRQHDQHDDPHPHHDHKPVLPRQPVYHPCTQMAGDRSVC